MSCYTLVVCMLATFMCDTPVGAGLHVVVPDSSRMASKKEPGSMFGVPPVLRHAFGGLEGSLAAWEPDSFNSCSVGHAELFLYFFFRFLSQRLCAACVYVC